MKKLLVICGSTATGKTTLALSLAKKFDGEAVSADSRQVYRSLDIGTGKDLPADAYFRTTSIKWKQKNIGYYKMNGIRVWGYDLVSPKEDFSVSKYVKVAEKIISDIEEREKLPILVGGTGLYIKSVIDGIPTANIPRNNRLRRSLGKKDVRELFESLARLDSSRAANMNSSDRKNPRRLIRAIEIAQWRILHKRVEGKIFTEKRDVLMVGLRMNKNLLDQRIMKRIQKRLSQGMIDEVLSLLSRGVSWDYQSMDSLGYREWKGYLLGKMTKEEVIDRWFTDEKSYAKRQVTWFKKDKRISWFDVGKEGWREAIEKFVRNWYYKENATKD